MSRLSRDSIIFSVRNDSPHDIGIEPFDIDNVGPSSVDLTLGREYKKLIEGASVPVDQKDCSFVTVSEDNDRLTIGPDEKVLATTAETVSIPSTLDAVVYNRSSVGRLFMHVETAGYIDPGFTGQITLELVNHTNNTYHLPIGMRICQLVFTELDSETISYGERDSSKYQQQSGPTTSSLTEDFS